MSISALFPGMEAYLDGDVEINNNVTTPEEDAAHEVEAADQTADIATDVGEVETDVKNDDVATQMLLRTGRLYYHVKRFGVDRTFLRLYNQHGEMDRMCGIQFPSCEAMNATGNPYSRYSAAFIAAMEDEKEGFWAKIWGWIQDAWKWLKDHIAALWNKILQFFGVRARDLQKFIDEVKQNYDTNVDVTLAKGSFLAAAYTEQNNSDNMGSQVTTLVTNAKGIFSLASKLNSLGLGENASNTVSQVDSNLNIIKAAAKKIADHNKTTVADAPEMKKKLQEVLERLLGFLKDAKGMLDQQSQLKKDSENALKAVANVVKSAKNAADSDEAKKAIGETALKITNGVKEVNGAITSTGKYCVRTINTYLKELKGIVKQLKPKEKPADNAGGDASDKSGGDKNATAMFAFL